MHLVKSFVFLLCFCVFMTCLSQGLSALPQTENLTHQPRTTNLDRTPGFGNFVGAVSLKEQSMGLAYENGLIFYVAQDHDAIVGADAYTGQTIYYLPCKQAGSSGICGLAVRDGNLYTFDISGMRILIYRYDNGLYYGDIALTNSVNGLACDDQMILYGAQGYNNKIVMIDLLYGTVLGHIDTDLPFPPRGLAINRNTYSFYVMSSKNTLYKLDYNGSTLESRYFGGGWGVAHDGEYVWTDYDNPYHARKLDDNEGSTDVVLELIPINPPIAIPHGGGSFDYDVILTNNTDDVQPIQVWTDVVVPHDMQSKGPLYGPKPMTLQPYEVFTTRVTQNVPGYVLPGWSYLFCGHVSFVNGNSDDYFPVIKQ